MQKLNVETTESNHNGFTGVFEKLLRRFKVAMYIILMIPIYILGCFIIGICLAPGIALFRMVSEVAVLQPIWIQNILYGLSIAAGFFIYGACVVFVAPLINLLIGRRLKAFKGPYYSVETFKWFLHNGLTYLVRYSFLEFITPSPLAILFYQMMGMKIGSGVHINSTWLSDPSLIEIGDKTTIGGSAAIVAHYAQGGMLVIAPVKIGSSCTIGIKATIMGGVTIGDGAKILPHTVLLPKTVVPAGETWGGSPAQKIELKQFYSGAKKVTS
ncbi:MAG: hypothetical protein AABY53_00610 [Bdellovibrionota bacterium]